MMIHHIISIVVMCAHHYAPYLHDHVQLWAKWWGWIRSGWAAYKKICKKRQPVPALPSSSQEDTLPTVIVSQATEVEATPTVTDKKGKKRKKKRKGNKKKHK